MLQDTPTMSWWVRYTNNDTNNDTSRKQFEDYRHKYFKQLRNGWFKVRFSENFLKCPFCADNKDYGYNDLLWHANRIASESETTAGLKEKAEHLELVAYLEKDFHDKIKCFDSTIVNFTLKQNSNEERYVWPWMAVIADVPVEYKNDNGKKLKDELTEKGYDQAKVHLLWNRRSYSAPAVVEFGKTWDGYFHVMKFIKAFENKLYAWIATAEDYNRYGVVGDYLRENGDLKTVSDVPKKDDSVVLELKAILGDLDKRIEDMNGKISKIDVQLDTVVKQKRVMTENFNRDKEMMQKEADEQDKMITAKHERAKRTKWLLDDREKGLRAREALNEIEQRKLDDEKRIMIELEVLEQNKANERGLKLAEDQKREKEKLHQKINELQKKLEEKQRLELRIKQMKKIIDLQRDLKEKEEDIKDMEVLNQALILKERVSIDELVETRKELISGLSENTGPARVVVKRIGELDKKPFISAAKKDYGKMGDSYGKKVASVWENHLRDHSWYPFKVITVEGKSKEILDEEDEKIVRLRYIHDEDVYDAVVTALKELNKYNPIGRYPVQELWNTMEERPATLKECAEAVLNQWKNCKRERG